MWDLIVSVPGHCLSFYFQNPGHTFLPTFPYLILVESDRHGGRRM